ncbi:glycosyltransferase [Nesterenkonia pannonica]|uniref:glycosyltransferase n=1 Tax=Nesterenkonia pannonica TaxID=1548602 RepID=UPI002164DDEC|nr:glycosyltransferase [Nesterenkonia pannonica]
MPGQTVPKVLQGLIRAGGGADVVHAHMTAAECAAAAASYCPTRGTPLVVTRHFAGPRGSSRLGGLAAKLIVRRSDAQIAISGYVADRVEGASTVIFPGWRARICRARSESPSC